MSIKQALMVLTTLAVLCCLGVRAESQLARRGTYSVHYWWQASGKWYAIEKDHTFWVGESSGTIFNDSGEGFLHRASAVCPGVRDVFKEFVNAHGYCVITDEDDDKAMLAWRCKGEGRCVGDAEWMGGTGKYTGLKGHHTVYGVVRSGNLDGSSGCAVFKGEWQLPD